MPSTTLAIRARRVLVLLFVWALFASPVNAALIVFVDDLGDCQGGVPCFTTIQQGVNNASALPNERAEVRVFPGTYNESVDLFLTGSAVGGMPVDLLIVNTELLGLTSAPASSSATSSSPPPWLPAELVEQLERARQRMPQGELSASASQGPEGGAAAAPVQAVAINSPAGPAIHGSNLAIDVTMVGLDVHSPNADGVDIISDGLLNFNFGTANSNFGNGVTLESPTDDVGAVMSTFNGNGGAGLVLITSDGSISVVNCIADGNTLFGFSLLADSSVQVFSTPLPPDPLFTNRPTTVAARMNMLSGMVATSLSESVTVVDLSVLGGLPIAPTIIFDDNTLTGLIANGDEGVTVGGARANGNDLDGMSLASRESVVLLSVVAIGNQAQGIHITESDVVFALSITANRNRNGFVANSDGDTDFDGAFPIFGMLLVAISADDNMLNGVLLDAAGGPIRVFGSTMISNNVVGIQMQSPIMSQNQVNGSIICENAFGLAQETNALVNAEGNWWGSLSGPFHMTKNPGGTGNQVADATSGGGAGDVDFIPWIDTVTGSAPMGAMMLTPSAIRFQFSGGNGTVFLGGAPFPVIFGSSVFGPGTIPLFTVSTDNGVVATATGMGPSATTLLTEPGGIAEVSLIPFELGPATVTITGPCGLTGSFTVEVRAARLAPLLSGGGLLLALALLAGVAAVALRRSAVTG